MTFSLGWIKDKLIEKGGDVVGKFSEETGIVPYSIDPYQADVTKGVMRRGSIPTPFDLVTLKAQGFKSVISFVKENDPRTEAERDLVKANGMTAHRIPVRDNDAPTDAQVMQFLELMKDPANQPAYVHCQAGIGRTGVFVACYRMAVEGWSPTKALAEAESYGLTMLDQKEAILAFGSKMLWRRINPNMYPKLAPYPLK